MHSGFNRVVIGGGFSKENLFRMAVTNVRKDLFKKYYSKFSRYAQQLLEYHSFVPELSDKGKLNKRRVPHFLSSDRLFDIRVDEKNSRTTVVILLDGSGSMRMKDSQGVSRFDKAVSVAAAFAKMCEVDLRGKIGVEVYMKLQNRYSMGDKEISTPMSFVCYSSTQKKSYKKLLSLYCGFPDESGSSSYTPENRCLPAIVKDCNRRVPGKKVFVNLTDGESQDDLVRGCDGSKTTPPNDFQKRLLKKYTKVIEMYTLLIGFPFVKNHHYQNYGKNVIAANDANFIGTFVKSLKKIMEKDFEN
jgi:hypothetical protein